MPRILPVDDSVRRRDSGAVLPQPHSMAATGAAGNHRTALHVAVVNPNESADDEPFGAGLI